MTCARCQQENPGHARFCLGCGNRLAVACTRCGADLSGGARFCAQCGHQVGTPPSTVEARFASPGAYTPKHLAEKILTSKGALEGERKPVTVLFCDIAGSTATAERVGPEGMHRLLREFFELALAQVHRYEGTINQFLGDGFMALFGAPLAHEDHARRAVLAALGIERALRDQQAEVQNERSLALRMGLNTGFVVVGSIGDNLRMDYTAVGDTTHLAARLQQLAQPGMILLGESTARLVTGYVRLQALDPVSVKGRTEPVPVYRLEGLGRRRSPLDGIEERALTPFVGRDRELAMLRDLLAEVEAGEGRVVGIVGEPGVGKSRLLLEFRRTLAARPVTFLEGRCLSFGSVIPYLPVVDIIRNNCGVVETDTPEAIVKKVCLGLEEVGLDGTESAPYLLHLLGVREGTERLGGLSPEAIQARTFETLNQMSLHGSRHRPIIFAIEDAHWIDRTSQEYLETLAESLAGARILLLATFRPGYRPPWVEKSYATQLSLHRLAPSDSLRVVRAVIPPDRMSDPVARLILEKAEGNPFFLEEMARAVTEQSGAPANLSVPDTVHGVLMARIDRLPEGAKRVLQTASVLGREFSVPLLGALVEGGGAFEQHLLDLKRLEFVYERTTGAETVYVFKHALTQDVAYESLLESRRRVLHAAAGRALETLYADRFDDVYERLAHHYARAEAADKAVEYLVRSAEKAARVYANADAVRALEEALVHAERLPLPERDRHIVNIVTRLANSLYFLGRFEQTREVLRERQACVERLQDPALAGPYYFWLAHTYNHLGEHDLVATSAEHAIQAAERCGDEATLGKTYYVLAREAVFSARFRQGLEHGQRAVALLERTEERLWLGQSHCFVGINSCLLGRLDAALDAAARGREIGVENGDARTESYATWNRGWFFTTRGEWENGVEACRQSLQRSPDPFNTAAATGWLGYAYLEKGDPVAAIPLFEQSLQQWRQFGHETLVGWFGAWLSEAYLLGDRIDEARELAMQSLEISEAASNWSGVGWCQRALGRIAHSSGAQSAAKRHLEVAAQTFARIDARFEEARTRLVLAEVAHAAGEREAAMRHLGLAHTAFLALQAPRYVAQTEQRASGWRIKLSGVQAG